MCVEKIEQSIKVHDNIAQQPTLNNAPTEEKTHLYTNRIIFCQFHCFCFVFVVVHFFLYFIPCSPPPPPNIGPLLHYVSLIQCVSLWWSGMRLSCTLAPNGPSDGGELPPPPPPPPVVEIQVKCVHMCAHACVCLFAGHQRVLTIDTYTVGRNAQTRIISSFFSILHHFKNVYFCTNEIKSHPHTHETDALAAIPIQHLNGIIFQQFNVTINADVINQCLHFGNVAYDIGSLSKITAARDMDLLKTL